MTHPSVQPANDVVDIHVDGRCLVIDPRGERVFVLNETGSWLWTLIRNGGYEPGRTRWLAEVTGEPWARVLKDVETFLAELQAAALVRPGDSAPPVLVDSAPTSLPDNYVPPAIELSLPLEVHAGTPLEKDPDPLLDPLAPLRFPERKR